MPTANSPALPVQQGIHDLLDGDAELTGLINGVFDHVPETAERPWVQLAESVETPDNAHGQFGSNTVQTLRIWTRNRGHREGLLIEARVRQLLDHQHQTLDPLVSGHRVIAVRLVTRQALIDPEPPGDIRQIPVQFRVTTEQL